MRILTTALVLAAIGLFAPGARAQIFSEDFEGAWPGSWVTVGGPHSIDPTGAHDGANGVMGSGGWIYNNTSTVMEGDRLTVWTRAVSGQRTYLGFDATAAGCKSFVFCPNTQDIRFQTNNGYGYTELTTMPVALSTGEWYFMEVELMPGGLARGRLFDNTGTGLVAEVSHNYGSFSFNGIALRAGWSTHKADTLEHWPGEAPSCTISSPVPAATAGGDVDIVFDVEDPQMDPITMSFEWSTDTGATWQPMTAAASSALTNPTLSQPTPATGLVFTWDSVTDAIGLLVVETTQLRINVSDAMWLTDCTVAVEVDNILPIPVCTITSPPGILGSDISFDITLLSISSPYVDSVVEFSTDGGATWLPATATAGSPLPNPGMGTLVGANVFIWDSRTDGVGTMGITPGVLLQITVTDGVSILPGICTSAPFDVDNTMLCGGICGDCNENGFGPDIIDALTGAQIAAGLLVPSASQQACCDVNASGIVDVIDALFMAQSAAGLMATLTCL